MKRINVLSAGIVGIVLACSCTRGPEWPGLTDNGTRLPNHWMLTPAGTSIPVGDLPLNMALSPDGRLLALTNNGMTRQFISVIDAAENTVVAELDLAKGFYGLVFSPDGRYLFASGGADDTVLAWAVNGFEFTDKGDVKLRNEGISQPLFPAGLAVSPDQSLLYVAENRNGTMAVVAIDSMAVKDRIPVGEYPYDIKVTDNGGKVYVSLWGGKSLCVCGPDGSVTGRIEVGDHPNAMLVSPSASLLYVACSNTDDIWVIDTANDTVIETISLHPYPNAPFGSTPNALALSSDGSTLYVANATNNDVAVVDVSRRGNSVVMGLIPVGWYPTALMLTMDGKKLFVANAKGLSSKPNPNGPNPYKAGTRETEYIGNLFNGIVSVIPVPDGAQLKKYTRQVEKNNGFNEAAKRIVEKQRNVKPQPVPRRVGESSPIKHVVYIIKENRTYDQVLGDLPRGNGDPDICLFGRSITPNQHAFADEFVLFDNFYVDAEVSADGHEWSTAAIATDFVEKTWPTSYSGRGLPYPSGGVYEIAFPTKGYIWEAVARNGLSYRSYGEFVNIVEGRITAEHPALEGHVSPTYRPWDLTYPDTLRAESFIGELAEFERTGDFPNFIIMHLPNNHTDGTRPGAPTPRAMVADNDLALGRIVEAISRSSFWKETAIFVIEDDAQNGPDHVDAHRTIAFAISPYIKRGTVDHTMYDTVSILRTIELILGLAPMSQYDAASFPLVASFTNKPDVSPYTALRPDVPFDEVNSPTAYGGRESLAMDFSTEDATPEIRLNEIIWKSVRGEDSEMPRPINRRGSTDYD